MNNLNILERLSLSGKDNNNRVDNRQKISGGVFGRPLQPTRTRSSILDPSEDNLLSIAFTFGVESLEGVPLED